MSNHLARTDQRPPQWDHCRLLFQPELQECKLLLAFFGISKVANKEEIFLKKLQEV